MEKKFLPQQKYKTFTASKQTYEKKFFDKVIELLKNISRLIRIALKFFSYRRSSECELE